MKFAKSLLRNQVPEWAANYIDYKALKKLIKQTQADPQASTQFFYALDRNVEIVDKFYNSKHSEYSRRLRYLVEKFEPQHSNLDVDEMDDLIGILVELRAQLRKLQWFADINKRGFAKILKKFDKKVGTSTQTRYLSLKILILAFASPNVINEQLSKINTYLKELSSESSVEDMLNGNLRPRTLSNNSTESTDDLAEYFRALELDDAESLEKLYASSPVAAKSTISLLLKAMFSYKPRSIKFLTQQLEAMDDPTEINSRNLIHRCIIQYGRSAPTNIVGNEFNHVAHNGSRGNTPQGENSKSSVVEDSVKILLEAMPEHARSALATRDQQLRTPLHYSGRFGLVEITKILVEYLSKWDLIPDGVVGAEWQDSEGMTPLDLAIIHNHAETTRAILGAAVPESAAIDHLLLTAVCTNKAIVSVLLDFGCNIDYQDPRTGDTALYTAAKHDLDEILQILIDQGANLELYEHNYHWTPLFVAAVDGSTSIAKRLIAAGASTNCTDLSGWTPKEHAALRGHIELSRLFPFLPYEQSPEPEATTREATPEALPEAVPEATPEAAPEAAPEAVPVQAPSALNKRNARTVPDFIKTVGHRYLADTSTTMILVTLGWKDLRMAGNPITLDSVPFAQAGQTELDTALSLVVNATNCSGAPLIVDLPLAEYDNCTEQVSFYTDDIKSVQLNFDLVPTYGSSSKILGRAVALLENIVKKVGESRYNLNDTITLPILECSTLRVLGTVSFGFLLVTPFSHPNVGIEKSQTYWKSLISSRVIGHRGLGKNTVGTGSLQLGENTVESFIQAANLGASYVEFDVQLTRDHVPVIYHDFIVSETGLDIPMHHLTLEQFMHLHETAEEQKVVDDMELSRRSNRSKSVGNVKKLDKEDRLHLTQDFRTRGVKGNVRGHSIHSRFATLEELFRTLPTSVGFNIECKYPMLDECEAEDFEGVAIDINTWVDTMLKVVYDCKGERDIIFSSFNPDVCICLSLKQPSIPVLFLTEAGTAPMYDFRASSLQEAIRFATQWNLLGLVPESTPLVDCPRLVQAVKQNGLVCFTYGTLNNTPEYARRQLRAGVDAVIVDSVLAVRAELTKDLT